MKKQNDAIPSATKTRNRIQKAWLMVMLLCLALTGAFAQTTQTFTTSGTFTVPAGVTSITVSAWGGGGAGGGVNGQTRGGGGGEGGSFVRGTITVVPSATYTVVVGNGGTGADAANGTAGQASSFSVPAGATLFNAIGGTFGAVGASFGAGGNATNTGNIVSGTTQSNFYGGNGGAANNTNSASSGGGGGSAGAGGNGGNGGTPLTGGTAGAGSGSPSDPGIVGATGRGSMNDGDGIAGGAPGAGGSGARNANDNTDFQGGNGGAGQVKVTWTCSTYALTATANAGACSSTGTSTITLTGSAAGLPVGTYTVTYNRGTPSATGLTASMTVSVAGSGTFTASGLTTAGSSLITITNLTSGTTGGTCSSNTSTNNTTTVTVTAAPTVTFTAQPGASTCVSTDVTYTTQSGQSNYVWTVPGVLNTDYSITSGGTGTTSNTVTLKWLTPGSKTVTINYTNAGGCTAASPTSSTATTVNARPTVTFTAQPGANGCLNTDVTYTTQSGQSAYVWTVPGVLNTDYSITSGGIGASNNTVTLKWLTTGSKTVSINYNNASGCTAASATSSTATTINTLPTVTFTTQPGASVCSNTDVTYTTQSGQSNYAWSVPGTLNTDYSITSGGVGSSSNTVTLKWLTAGSKTVTINYSNANGCSATSPTSSTPTTVSARPNVTFTSQPGANACLNNDVTYTTQSGQSNYVWTVPGVLNTDYSITSGGIGASNNTVTLKWLTTGSKTLTINYTNAAGCTAVSATSSTATTVNALPTVTFTAQPGASACSGTDVTYTTQSGQSSYVWTVPGVLNTDYSITSGGVGSSSNTVTLKWLTAGSKTVTINYNNAAGCTAATATSSTPTTVTLAATAVAGTAINTCGYLTAVNITAGSSSTNNNGITWTSNGSGTFANANSLTTCTYTPSAADVAAGSRILTLTATGNSPCGNVTSTKTITFVALPSAVSVTPAAATVCASATSTALTGAATTTATVNVNTDNFTGTPTYTGSGSTTGSRSQIFTKETSGTTVNSVGTFTSPNGGGIMIAMAAVPTSGSNPNTSSANTLLTSPAINTNNFSSLTLSYNHSYKQGNSGSPSGKVEVSINGSTWTTVKTFTTDQGGATAFVADNIILSNTNLNQSNFQVRFNFVSSNSTAFLSNSSWWAIDDVLLNGVPVALYSWSSNTGSGIDGLPGGAGTPAIANKNITVVPTATTIYTVTATDQVTGCTNTSTSTVTVNPVATVSAGSTQTICSNQTATMNGAFGGGASSATWSTLGTGSFNNNNVNAIYTPSLADINAGSVILTYTTDDPAGPCGSINASMTLNINKVPSISSQPSNVVVCENGNATFTVGATGAGLTYQWRKGTTDLVNSGTISGALTASLTITGVVVGDAASDYNCVVSGTCAPSVTSNNASLTVNTLPVISSNGNLSVNTAGNCNATITNAQLLAQVTSTGSPAPSVTFNPVAGNFVVGTTLVTATAQNTCGSVQTSFNVVVTDNENPVITCPATANITADAGLCTSSASIGTATATDNCLVASVVASPAGPYSVGTHTITWTATDNHGNIATCTQTVNVTDNQNPVISSCPSNTNLNNDGGLCSAVATWAAPTAADNCGIQSLTSNHNSGDTFPVGTTIVIYTATDVHGNVATCSFNVVVTDNEFPVISNCPANINLNNDTGLCSAVATWTVPTASDNCGIQSLTSNHNSGDAFAVGTTVVTYTATDVHGNIATCSFNVVVTDNELPVITCPAIANIITDTGMCTSSASIGTATATDNCSVASVVASPAGPYSVGSHSITWTATDVQGNIASCTQIVNVTDGENPVAVCQNITVELDVNHTYTVTAAELNNGSTDNCGVASVTITNGQVTYGCSDVGNTYPVTISVTDAQGNIATCVANVTVSATTNPCCTAPVISCAGPLAVNTDAGVCGATITNAQLLAQVASVSGNPAPTVTFVPAAGLFVTGTTSVTATATNGCGVPTTCTFNVTVTDNENPVITCPATANISADAGLCTSTASIGIATATDNCSVASVIASPAGPYSLGTHTITWTATDIHGNISTCTQTVIVTDGENPVITGCPSNITVNNDAGTCGAVVTYTAPLATDNCSGATIGGSHNSGDTFPLGVTTVTYTATDASGNTATCSFNVTVNSTAPTAPTSATSSAPFDNICLGNNVTLTANGGSLGTMGGDYKWYTGSCGGTLVGTGVSISQSPVVTTTYFVRVEDNCGNLSSCASVTVTLSFIPDSANVILPISGMPAYICTGTTATLSIAPVAGATQYTWDVPTGGYFNGNPSNVSPFITASPSVQVTYGAPVASLYTTGVQAGNACGNSIRKQQKTRGTTSVPAGIAGPLTACANSSITYNTVAVSGATSYLWTITGDATVSGTGTTVTVNFGPSWNSGSLCVSAQTTCYTSPSKCITINKSASVTNAISGTFTACPGASLGYAVAPSTGAASYAWSVPANSSVSNGQGTANLTVAYGAGYNATGNICVTVTSICGVASPVKCKTVAPGLPTVPASINGPTNGICNQTVVFTCPNQTGVTFTWTVPAGATIQAGQGSNSVSVQFGSFTTASLSVKANNACGSSANRTITVKGAPKTPTSIVATPSSWCNNTQGIEFAANTSSLNGAYTMSWSYPSSSVATYVLGGGNSSSLVLDWIQGNGTIMATAFNSCGSGTAVLNTGSTCREAQVNSNEQMLSVFPNPTAGLVNISYKAQKGNTLIRVSDLSGRMVMTKNVASVDGNNNAQLDMTKLSKGAYMLSIQTSEGIKQVKVAVE